MKKNNSSQMIKNSIRTEIQATKVSGPLYESFYDLQTFRQKPVSKAFIDKLAHELIEWANIDEEGKESLRISDFYLARYITGKDFYRWVQKYDVLKEANEYALAAVASRRELGALRKRYDAPSVFRSLGHYCKIQKTEEERIASLKKDPEQKPTTFIVQMPSLDSSQLVPDKKNEHDENEQL